MVSSEFVAAADLGSNSFHLIVGKVDHGRFVTVDRMRNIVRLGAGLDENMNLTEESQNRALAALSEFGQLVQNIPSTNFRAVGTNTLRKAHNAAQFLKKAQSALGHPIEVISGQEEARLIYTSVCYGRPNNKERKLVIDIGGGSTEIISGTDVSENSPDLLESLYVGCVSLSRAHFEDGKITRHRMHQAELDAMLEIQTCNQAFLKRGWDRAIGCSGTIRAVANALQHLGWGSGQIKREALYRLINSISALNDVGELGTLGFGEDRYAVLPGGISVLAALFELLKIDTMHVSDEALREGVIYDLLGRLRDEDVRDYTIEALAKSWRVDRAHALQVRSTALGLFDQVADDWDLVDPEHRSLLAWAAELHEIGLSISHSQYHKHGAYLLENSELAGFSRPEQSALARLVRGHRRKFPYKELANQTHLPKSVMRKLCILLRVGVLLHRSRTAAATGIVRCHVDENQIYLQVPNGWADEHPLTFQDLMREGKYLRSAKFELRINSQSESQS